MGLTAAYVPRPVRTITRWRAAAWIIMPMALLFGRPADASQPLDGLLACRKITASAPRLACFDRESAAIAEHMATIAGPSTPTAALPPTGAPAPTAAPAPTTEPAPTAAPPPKPVADTPVVADAGATAAHSSALDPVQTFGLPEGQILAREEAIQRAPRPLDHIEAHIVGMAAIGDGRELFTLDNDQVWEELEPDGDLYAKPGETVRISRGWLGSYMLSLKSRRSSKVTRLH